MSDIIYMKEINFSTYKDVYDIFGEKIVKEFRKKQGGCLDVAWGLKDIFNKNGILAEIVTFKNGNAFLDGGIKVYDKVYMFHSVVLLGDGIVDILHTDAIVPTKVYIEELEEVNPKLRLDYTLSTCWYDDEGYPIKPSLDYLKNYKY